MKVRFEPTAKIIFEAESNAESAALRHWNLILDHIVDKELLMKLSKQLLITLGCGKDASLELEIRA